MLWYNWSFSSWKLQIHSECNLRKKKKIESNSWNMYVSEKVGVGVGTWRRRGRIDQRRETMRRISQWVRLSVPFLFAFTTKLNIKFGEKWLDIEYEEKEKEMTWADWIRNWSSGRRRGELEVKDRCRSLHIHIFIFSKSGSGNPIFRTFQEWIWN